MSNPFWKKIQNVFHDDVNWVQGKLTASEQEALKIGTASVHYVEQNGGQVLRDAASAAVISAETVAGGGEAKLAAAVVSVTAVLVKEGIPVIKAAVNLAIEMALADAKTAGLINDSTPAAV